MALWRDQGLRAPERWQAMCKLSHDGSGDCCATVWVDEERVWPQNRHMVASDVDVHLQECVSGCMGLVCVHVCVCVCLSLYV